MYIPHTTAEREAMLKTIGVARVDDLFERIPPSLRFTGELPIPPALTEMELTSHLSNLAEKNQAGHQAACFLGGGCYDHFVPAVVDVVASRSEYYTAYTPYQAEASQGTLQTGFEFQTMMCQMTGLAVANASLYEGATAVVEAMLVATQLGHKAGTILVSESVHPEYRLALATYLKNLTTELVTVPLKAGVTDLDALAKLCDSRTLCVILQSPNFFGLVEPMTQAIAIARRQPDAVVVQSFDPISLGLLRRPGDFGVDIAVAEGQSLGTPMSYGGPFLGIFACSEKFVRKIPGRVVGETVDRLGRRAFVLTLQTREQHIRREKATSNICTNQGLLALRASAYLSLLGPEGLRETANLCWQKARYAAERLAGVPGVQRKFAGKNFKEFVIELPGRADDYLAALLADGFHAGVPLGRWFPELSRCLLVAVTEKRTKDEIDRLAEAWKKALR